eukprot:181048-Chlamydomonas_euryale.AAC.1
MVWVRVWTGVGGIVCPAQWRCKCDCVICVTCAAPMRGFLQHWMDGWMKKKGWCGFGSVGRGAADAERAADANGGVERAAYAKRSADHHSKGGAELEWRREGEGVEPGDVCGGSQELRVGWRG